MSGEALATPLVVGAVYECPDGSTRRLRLIEDRYLTYDVLIDRKSHTFLSLGKTYRSQVESEFTDGGIVSGAIAHGPSVSTDAARLTDTEVV